jgi:hypothetical protein
MADLLEVRDPFWVQGEHGQPWPLNSSSPGYEASRVVKAGAGKLYGFTVYNSSGSTQFIQVHDAPGVPADGAVPCLVFSVATVSAVFVGFADVGRSFEQGCVLCNSSTGPTKTIGSADCFFDAQYI